MRVRDQIGLQVGRLGKAALLCCLTSAAEGRSVAATKACEAQTKSSTRIDEPCQRQSPLKEGAISRHAQLRELRLEKRRTLRPQRKEFFEKLLTRFDRGRFQAVQDSEYKGFYPHFGRIARGSGLAGGVSYLQSQFWGAVDLSTSAFYSVRGYRHFEMRLGLLPDGGKPMPAILSATEELVELGNLARARSSRLRLYATGRRRYHPQVAYFGSGADSEVSDETNFLLRDSLIEATLEYQIGRRLLGRLKTGFLQHSLGPGTRDRTRTLDELFDDSTAPGLDHPPRYWRTSGSLALDYRDNPGVPHRGFALALSWSRYDEVSGRDRFNFRRYQVDARGFVPLGSRQRVMALRFRLVDDQPAAGNRVPFFLQHALGDRHTLRGFDRSRFRGDKLMLYQAEYRWEPSRRFELALFADAGAVAGMGSKLSFSDLRSDFGIGFRVRTSRATVFRLEQAWSREARKTILSLAASF